MDKKKITIITLIVLTLVIVGVIVYWYWQSQNKVDVVVDKTDIVVDDIDIGDITLPDSVQPDDVDVVPPAKTSNNIQLVGSLYYFVERFGTYSNIVDFGNIEDIKPTMSDDFYNQVISNRKNITFAEESDLEYDAYDAKITKVDWTEESDTTATARVTTRRHHITNDTNDPFQQDIIVRFIKEGDNWLVIEAIWQ